MSKRFVRRPGFVDLGRRIEDLDELRYLHANLFPHLSPQSILWCFAMLELSAGEPEVIVIMPSTNRQNALGGIEEDAHRREHRPAEPEFLRTNKALMAAATASGHTPLLHRYSSWTNQCGSSSAECISELARKPTVFDRLVNDEVLLLRVRLDEKGHVPINGLERGHVKAAKFWRREGSEGHGYEVSVVDGNRPSDNGVTFNVRARKALTMKLLSVQSP
jgi:hypothetical protein